VHSHPNIPAVFLLGFYLLVVACTRTEPSASGVDAVVLSDHDQVEHIAISHGFMCAPKRDYQGTPRSSCYLGRNTGLIFIAGPGFDGPAAFDGRFSTCPDLGGLRGWIWAGDGYLIRMYLEGDSPNRTELDMKAAFGSPTCEF
jgi:hypothetical protein